MWIYETEAGVFQVKRILNGSLAYAPSGKLEFEVVREFPTRALARMFMAGALSR